VKNKCRVVFDANVLVSALLFKNSKPRKAFDKALDKGDIIISVPVLLELNKVLSRKKFNKYLLDTEKKAFLALLFREAELKETLEEIRVCRDPKDNKYLELAVSGDAKYVITGDKDLLVLNPFRQINILTPEQFLTLDLE
jgi:putative PIN family toxin of toxin-antitoxin system